MSTSNTSRAHYTWNLTRLGEAFGLHRDTVRKRLRGSGIEPVGSKDGAPLYDLRDAGPAIFEGQTGYSSYDPDSMSPVERLAYYQAERYRCRFEQSMGELRPSDDIHREMAETAKMLANLFDTLPDLLERDHGLAADKLALVEQTLDRVRMELFEAVCSADEDD